MNAVTAILCPVGSVCVAAVPLYCFKRVPSLGDPKKAVKMSCCVAVSRIAWAAEAGRAEPLEDCDLNGKT